MLGFLIVCFIRNCPVCSRVAALVCIPTSSACGIQFLFVLTTFGGVIFVKIDENKLQLK